MIGVIVKENGEVVSKIVMCGNDDKNLKTIGEEKYKNPSKEYIVYDDSKISEFESIEVGRSKTPEQLEWDELKGTASKIEALFAKVLKLDA